MPADSCTRVSKLLFNCDEVHDVSTSDGVRGTKHTVFSLFAACFAQIIAGLCTIINFQSLKHISPPYNTSGHISHKGGGGPAFMGTQGGQQCNNHVHPDINYDNQILF